MNAARPAPLPFTPTPDRLAEYDRMARRARELAARERALLSTWAAMGTVETHSPHYGLVAWDFGAGGLSVNAHNADELGEN